MQENPIICRACVLQTTNYNPKTSKTLCRPCVNKHKRQQYLHNEDLRKKKLERNKAHYAKVKDTPEQQEKRVQACIKRRLARLEQCKQEVEGGKLGDGSGIKTFKVYIYVQSIH